MSAGVSSALGVGEMHGFCLFAVLWGLGVALRGAEGIGLTGVRGESCMTAVLMLVREKSVWQQQSTEVDSVGSDGPLVDRNPVDGSLRNEQRRTSQAAQSRGRGHCETAIRDRTQQAGVHRRGCEQLN